MNTSSETLFHFTHSRNNLESILDHRFHLAYCRETLTFDDLSDTMYFPMVTFCDIPLSMSFDHVVKYGGYGIGLSKEWGIRNRLNPVTYIESKSQLAIDLKNSLIAITKLLTNTKDMASESEQTVIKMSQEIAEAQAQGQEAPPWIANSILRLKAELKANRELLRSSDNLRFTVRLLRYTKNYQGTLVRGKKTYTNYKFYDEKEWRFVPDENFPGVEFHLNQKKYEEYRSQSKAKPLLTDTQLDFTTSDIKYLIVKTEKDVSKLIQNISKIKGLTNSKNEYDLLITKIMTIKQLTTDF